jgi:hypothetical protein
VNKFFSLPRAFARRRFHPLTWKRRWKVLVPTCSAAKSLPSASRRRSPWGSPSGFRRSSVSHLDRARPRLPFSPEQDRRRARPVRGESVDASRRLRVRLPARPMDPDYDRERAAAGLGTAAAPATSGPSGAGLRAASALSFLVGTTVIAVAIDWRPTCSSSRSFGSITAAIPGSPFAPPSAATTGHCARNNSRRSAPPRSHPSAYLGRALARDSPAPAAILQARQPPPVSLARLRGGEQELPVFRRGERR